MRVIKMLKLFQQWYILT